MNTKLTQNFSFNFPLTKKVVDLSQRKGFRFQHIGDLLISGVGYMDVSKTILEEDKFSADIETIEWNGTDIKEVVELTDMDEEIYTASLAHVTGMFENQLEVA